MTDAPAVGQPPALEFHHGKPPTGPARHTEFIDVEPSHFSGPKWASRRQVSQWQFLHWRFCREHPSLSRCACAKAISDSR